MTFSATLRRRRSDPRRALSSAATGQGVDQLLAVIDEVLPGDPLVRTTFHLSAGDGATLALLHEFGRVIEVRYQGEDCEVEAEVPESLTRRIPIPPGGQTS